MDANTFGDSEGDSYTLYAFNSGTPELPLPSWLTFTPFNRTFAGIAPDSSTLDVIIYAIDSASQLASTTFTITLTNAGPTKNVNITDMNINTMQLFTYKFPSNYYTDADGHSLKMTSDIGT